MPLSPPPLLLLSSSSPPPPLQESWLTPIAFIFTALDVNELNYMAQRQRPQLHGISAEDQAESQRPAQGCEVAEAGWPTFARAEAREGTSSRRSVRIPSKRAQW